MDIGQILGIVFIIVLVGAALYFKPLRKATGLLLIILGAIACFTVIGIVFGIPMIIVGGILLFI